MTFENKLQSSVCACQKVLKRFFKVNAFVLQAKVQIITLTSEPFKIVDWK